MGVCLGIFNFMLFNAVGLRVSLSLRHLCSFF